MLDQDTMGMNRSPRLNFVAAEVTGQAVADLVPPVSSTGGKTGGGLAEGLWAMIDYFSCTFPTRSREAVEQLVTAHLGEPEPTRGLHSYEQGVRWNGGGVLCWSEGRAEAWLSLSGEPIRAIGHQPFYELLHDLRALNVKPTRIDTTVDDENRRVKVEQVVEAAEAGQFARFRRYRPVVDREWKFRAGTRVNRGASIRFGTRGGDGAGRSLLVYDKALESDGENPAIRWEVTWSDKPAQAVWEVLMQDERYEFGKFARRIGRAVRSSIEFVDRTTSDRASEMDPLPWWQEFAQLLGDLVQTTVARNKPKLQATIEALCKQYGPALGYVFDLLGPEGMESFVALAWAQHHRCNKRRYGEDVSVDLVAAFALAGPAGDPAGGAAGPPIWEEVRYV